MRQGGRGGAASQRTVATMASEDRLLMLRLGYLGGLILAPGEAAMARATLNKVVTVKPALE